jgi:hypothetical protein
VILAALLFLSADNPELEALKKVDQSDRHFVSSPQEIDWHKIGARDQARQQRVRELLLSDQVHTARDFDNAALIMQHGSKPADYLLAHELAAIAAYKGNFGSLPALAEDRWLNSIGQEQRWGSQFDWQGKVKPIRKTAAGVTDQMRRDLLLPTLDEIDGFGQRAPMHDFDGKIAYIEKRLANRDAPAQPVFSSATIDQTIRLIRDHKVVSAADYATAADTLSKSNRPEELLLAHELSVIAMAWRAPAAPRLFAKTLDGFLRSTGLPPRYAGGAVARGVRRELGL